MSRTDRDRPYRVRAADPHEPRVAVHSHVPRWSRRPKAGDADYDCDLPDYHDRTPEDATTRRYTWNSPNCYWQMPYWVFSPYGGGPPKWYRDHVWTNPERLRERLELGEARKRWNAGDLLEDFDFACWANHREGGYWD
jgi:hypothetical protein